MLSEEKKTIALVTGASGFVAGSLIRELLATGRYTVRGTVRNIGNKSKVAHLEDKFAGIELFESDLLKEGTFDKAVQGCDVVFHTASPFQFAVADPQKDLVDPAVNGTLNVLSAVDKSDTVKRVVLTSSVAAIGNMYNVKEGEYTEKDWNLTSNLEAGAYSYSKRMAEEAAWKAAKDKKWKLTTICPSFVLGPPMSDRGDSASVQAFKALLDGNMKQAKGSVAFGCVHVNDVASAHIKAAENPSAAGERFIVSSSGGFSMEVMCQVLIKSGQFEAFSLGENTFFPSLGENRFNNAKVREVLGLKFTPVEEAFVEMASALVALGIVSVPNEEKKTIALVTGASGYVAGPLIKHLTETGRYIVRGTVRNLHNPLKVSHLKTLYPDVELFEADLLKEGSFDLAAQGCDVIFHTASPFQLVVDDPQIDLVDPAIKGTLNVLSAADKADTVKRVVLTSSVAAIARGKPETYEYTEKDWNLQSTIESGPYPYSKRMAEEAAWKAAKDKKWKLSTICPSFVLGPPTSDRTDSVSVVTMKSLLEGSYHDMKAGFAFGCVHVDDIAKAHIKAAEIPSAAGERFMITSSTGFSIGDLCQILVDSREFESFPLEANKFITPAHRFRYNNMKVKKELGLELTSIEETVIEMAKSLIEFHIVEELSDTDTDDDDVDDEYDEESGDVASEFLSFRRQNSGLVQLKTDATAQYIQQQQKRKMFKRVNSITSHDLQHSPRSSPMNKTTFPVDEEPAEIAPVDDYVEPTRKTYNYELLDPQMKINLNYTLLQAVAGMTKSGELSFHQRGYIKNLIVRQSPRVLHIALSYVEHQNFYLFQSELVGLCKATHDSNASKWFGK